MIHFGRLSAVMSEPAELSRRHFHVFLFLLFGFFLLISAALGCLPREGCHPGRGGAGGSGRSAGRKRHFVASFNAGNPLVQVAEPIRFLHRSCEAFAQIEAFTQIESFAQIESFTQIEAVTQIEAFLYSS